MTLEYSDVLQILAEVAVTLTGFIGVILVVQHGGRGPWSESEKNSMFHLLYASLGLLGLSLLPLLIQPGFQESTSIWRICNPIMGVIHVYGATRGTVESRRGKISMPRLSAIVFPAGSFLIVLLTIAIASGFLLSFAPLVYLIGLACLLGVAVFSFVHLLFRGFA